MNILKLFLESANDTSSDSSMSKLTKKEIESLIKEWNFLEKNAAVLTALAKKISSRISEIEEVMLPIVKEEETKSVLVKHSLVEYKTRNVTSVKYQKAFEKALEVVNEEQKEFLENFKETVTSRSISEKVNLVDPKLADYIKQVNSLDVTSLIELLPKSKTISEGVSRSVVLKQQISDLLDKHKKTSDVREKSRINTEIGKLNKELRVSLDREYETDVGLKESAALDKLKGFIESFKNKLKVLTRKQKRSVSAAEALEDVAKSKD